MIQKKKQYTREQKAEAVDLYLGGMSQSEVARSKDIILGTFNNWAVKAVKNGRKNPYRGSPPLGGDPATKPKGKGLVAEVEAIKATMEQLRLLVNAVAEKITG